ncbi:SDR family oxidoreductase [Thalassotalea sp. 1_MG-2023]|uniref:SDR family oxidoreductase n=1 Tax=Thalassotalea sp. 1_MG-2023 TaxID=3062680 RepID=UPI0026E2EAA1|nr:SDR family oxidoreductase [Thalassotalea sp. 1_MG-2023]MDO6427843.1 SDR family oxidoreductase [Thalassotalea sp. 1_MG-2023]
MNNTIALVTGASRGIGAATAKMLAKQNVTVIVNYLRNQQAADNVVDEILASGGNAKAIQADVSKEGDIKALFDEIDLLNGNLTQLVNNAGTLFEQSSIENMTAERINKVLSINVTSYFLCCREAVKRMSTKHGGNGGAIVNVSSAASRLGAPHEYIDYAASKGAIDTLTTGLSLEVADADIRVNGVRPGLIYTDIHSQGGEPNRVDRLSPNLPMKRGGHVDEVAHAICWLLSEEASYCTGSQLDLAGGK